jgi:hypothetical protein
VKPRASHDIVGRSRRAAPIACGARSHPEVFRPEAPMKSFLPAAAFVASCCVASCSSIDVSHDYDKSYDFSTLKSWSWHPTAAASSDSNAVVSLTDARIRSAVESELASRGYSEVHDGASFLVAYHAVIQQKIDPGTNPYGYGWSHAYMGPTVMTYDEGTLLIDFIDPKSKSMIWRGTASAVVDASDSAEKREKRIHEAVHKVLEDFPPKK